MSGTTMRVLRTADIPAATDVLVRGFDQEPAKLTLMPDPRPRRALLEAATGSRLREAVRRGTAYAAFVGDEPAAVAVWVPPGMKELSVSGGVRFAARMFASLTAVVPAVPHIFSVLRTDVSGLIRLVRGRRRAVAQASKGQTWNLVLLATVPEHRGKGLARMLLDRQLDRCDEDGTAVWLETTDPVNVPIYERFGFETVVHLDGPAWLPGLWVMRRAPRLP